MTTAAPQERRFDFGVDFKSAAERLRDEEVTRLALVKRALPFNVQFLDDALGCILPNDLILIGARTGAGKTALATLVAQKNAELGRRVHYFALEAEDREIERRMKYRVLVDMFYESMKKCPVCRSHRKPPRCAAHDEPRRLSYREWYLGRVEGLLGRYKGEAEDRLARQFTTLYTYYRGQEFTVEDLDKIFRAIQDVTDLIVLDHLQYVDTDDSNDNRAFKTIVKRIRDVSLSIGKPVFVVAHLRKKERGSTALIPEIDDFHGTSDITKIATKVILLSPSRLRPKQPHLSETFMCIPKDRMDGIKWELAKMGFDRRRGAYDDEYILGRIGGENSDEFEQLNADELPFWAQHAVRVTAPPSSRQEPEQQEMPLGRDPGEEG